MALESGRYMETVGWMSKSSMAERRAGSLMYRQVLIWITTEARRTSPSLDVTWTPTELHMR